MADILNQNVLLFSESFYALNVQIESILPQEFYALCVNRATRRKEAKSEIRFLAAFFKGRTDV